MVSVSSIFLPSSADSAVKIVNTLRKAARKEVTLLGSSSMYSTLISLSSMGFYGGKSMIDTLKLIKSLINGAIMTKRKEICYFFIF
jgi:hypothetical protein